jgi:hypothetical protein
VSFNSRRDSQNRKDKRDKRDGAADYGEDQNVVVCKKHGVHHAMTSNASLGRQGCREGGSAAAL